MYIKAKIVGSDGEIKGRGYAYEADIDLSVGDLIIADLAGSDKLLSVTEVDVEVGEVDFEIKKIKRLATEEDMPTENSIDMKIVNESLPVIKINYDEMKSALSEMLAKYKGIVVTADTLAGCKSTQKDLAGVRNKINRWRIDKAKEFSVPIKAFEAQCKELVALVEEVEKPIKEGIEVFDDKKRADKIKIAEDLIPVVAKKVGINEKYAKQLTVIDKYSNLSATKKEVQEDLESRAMALLAEQNREQDMLDIIVSTVEVENERLKSPMKPEDFTRLIDAGLPPKEVIAQIKLRANSIFDAENPVEEPAVEAPVVEPVAKTVAVPVTPKAELEEKPARFYAIYDIEGTEQELMSVSAFLRTSGITYKVSDQGEL